MNETVSMWIVTVLCVASGFIPGFVFAFIVSWRVRDKNQPLPPTTQQFLDIATFGIFGDKK